MKIALLCSGLGNINRGHETFARDLFELLKDTVDITLLKGGGDTTPRELVIENIPRNAATLRHIHLPVSPKWMTVAQEQERLRIETATFAHSALRPLLEGGFDVIHCLEQEVCNQLYAFRHLFENTPKFLFSNGGAIPSADLPACDFVQEHTEYNLKKNTSGKAFYLPHGVDTTRFHPGIHSDFRRRHAIPEDAFVVISVGTICYWHKRMDYVIREVAAIERAYLIIAGQECADTDAIRALGHQLMGQRIIFANLPHEELPQAYAAANAFTLGSLFETFGIVYIEAMAMGLPVFCTNHPNQRNIVGNGIFIDMTVPGALTRALKNVGESERSELGRLGMRRVADIYDMARLRERYVEHYKRMARSTVNLPRHTLGRKMLDNARNIARKLARQTRQSFL